MSDSYNNDMEDRSEHHDETNSTSQPTEPSEQVFDEIEVDIPAPADEPVRETIDEPEDISDVVVAMDEGVTAPVEPDEQPVPSGENTELDAAPSVELLIVEEISAESGIEDTALAGEGIADEPAAAVTPEDEPASEIVAMEPSEAMETAGEPAVAAEPGGAPEGETATEARPEPIAEPEDVTASHPVTTDEPEAVPSAETPVSAQVEPPAQSDNAPSPVAQPEAAAAPDVLPASRPASSPAPAPSTEPEPRLTHADRTALNTIAAGSGVQARQARIILDWGSGREAGQIAGELKLSQATVARTIRAFQAKRMESFAEAPLRVPTRRGRPHPPSAGQPAAVRITVEDLCRQYDVDMRHATHVAELAHQLFALTLPLHQLDEHYLDVIYIAGLLHNVAYSTDPKKHHTRGRDIILATPLSNINDDDRALVAVTTAFHRKAWSQDRLQKERSYLALPASAQQVALWLAAILRIADGLDYSQSQSTGLTESMIGRDICLIGVKGPHDKIDRSRANNKADMWRTVTGISLSVGSRKDVRQALRRRMPHRPDPAVVSADGTMSETGRALLRFHFQRMLYHEPGARSGLNSEPVHDMRVAVRRMISALDVFGGAYKGKVRRWMTRELRVLEDVLGGVRDLDVNIAQAEIYLETLPWEARPDLEQLIVDWKDLRDNNRSRLLRYLDSSKYADFADRMLTFCETPEADLTRSADSPTMLAVGHAAPAIIYLRYEAIRAYEPVIAEVPIATLHEVRGEAKRMRYVLEFFRDALGPEARDLIELFVRVQDHLGALQDADIACGFIQKYIKREVKKARQEGQDGQMVDISTRLYGINAYLDSRQNQIEAARKSFGPLWVEVVSPETRQMFARTVGVL